jgi:hypothetical protein
MHATPRDEEHDGDDRAIDAGSAAIPGGVNDVQHRAQQSYRRRGCGLAFNSLTGTRLARLRQRGERLLQAQGLDQGQTVRKALGIWVCTERLDFVCGIASQGGPATSRSRR